MRAFSRRALRLFLCAACLAAWASAQGRFPIPGVDSDGDGLSDEDELNKYFTDPARRSTAGDGVLDGDWERRREWTTTLRAVVRVRRPCAAEPWSDAFSDGRVLASNAEWVDLEIIGYYWNRGIEPRGAPDPRVKKLTGHLAANLAENDDWRGEKSNLEPWLRPGRVCWWDETIRASVVTALRASGIVPERLSDAQLVETAGPWLLSVSRCVSKTTLSYLFDLRGAQPELGNGLGRLFDAERPSEYADRWAYGNLVFSGRAMWSQRRYEWGLPWCAYFATVMRALGIPTRIVQFAPLIDAEDPAERLLLDGAVEHGALRRFLDQNARIFAAEHRLEEPFQVLTMNEVWVGRRWILVHVPKDLGGMLFPAGPIFYRATPGYLWRLHTFADPGDFDWGNTWGRLAAGLESSSNLPGPRPWKLLSLEEHRGRFNRMDVLCSGQVEPKLPRLPASLVSEFGDESMGSAIAEVASGLGYYAAPRARELHRVNFYLRAEGDAPASNETDAPRAPSRPVSGRFGGDRAANPGEEPARVRDATLSVQDVFWFQAARRPPSIPSSLSGSGDGGRYVLIRVGADEPRGVPMADFLRGCAQDLYLRAESGEPPLRLALTPLFWRDHLLFRMPKEDLARMQKEKPYRLVAGEQSAPWKWIVPDGLYLERSAKEGDAP